MFTVDTLWLFLLYNIITILVASVVYFLSKEYIKIKYNNYSFYNNLFLGLFLGTLISLVFVFLNYEYTIISDKATYSIYLNPFIIYLIIFPLVLDKKLAIPMFAIVFLCQLIQFPWNEINSESILFWDLVIIKLISMSVLFIFVTFMTKQASTFFKSNNKFIFWTFIGYQVMVFLSLSAIIVNGIVNHIITYTDLISLYFTSFAYAFIFFIVQFYLIIVFEKVYTNFTNLETFMIKDDISYYKLSLSKEKLKQFINTNIINNGLLILFNIEGNDTETKKNSLNNIRLQIEGIPKYKNLFFFKATTKYYGIFIGFNENLNLDLIYENNQKIFRDKDDILHYVDDIFNKISKESNLKINSAVSIYGVHSHSIDELIEFATLLFTPNISNLFKSQIKVYDYKLLKNKIQDKNLVLNLPFDFDGYNITFIQGISKEKIFYPDISWVNLNNKKRISLTNAIFESDNQEEKINLLRYFSYQTLRSFKNKADSKLTIFYSMEYLDDKNFNMDDFIKKIKKHIDIKKVIIGLWLDNKELGKRGTNVIRILRSLGIQFALLDPWDLNQEVHDLIMPEYIIDTTVSINPFKNKVKKLKINSNAIKLNIIM